MADIITVNQTDITNATNFMYQYLTDRFPNVDFGVGTANRDIAINANALMLAFLRNEILNVRNRQSLKTLALLPPEESVETAVVEILSNWFITRKEGQYSRGVPTLFFNTNDIGTVYISDQHTINKDTGVSFRPVNSQFIQGTDLTRNKSNAGSIYYTYPIEAICTATGANDIEPGTFSSWNIPSPYLYRIENFSKFQGGEGIEPIDMMIDRSKQAITVRDLNTRKSITTVLRETFSQVQDLTVLGYGDVEFQRDVLELSFGFSGAVKVHRGSMMDIYVKTPVIYGKSLTVTPQTTLIDGSQKQAFSLPAEPVLRIVSLQDTSTTPATNVSFTTVVNVFTTQLSKRQDAIVIVPSTYANTPLLMTYDTILGYEELQQYVEDPHQRILVADPLVKSLHPMYLKLDLRYEQTTIPLDVNVAKKALQDFVHSYPTGQELSVSEIVTQFSQNNAVSIKRLELPVTITGKLNLSTGDVIETVYTDRLEVPERFMKLNGAVSGLFGTTAATLGALEIYSKDVQLSQRTTRYILPLSDITITQV